MTVEVDPDHVAYRDPEWAADAAACALSDGYGIPAFYSEVEFTDGSDVDREERTYRFAVTFHADTDQVAFDDPEWAADAAHGAPTNDYGIETVYTDLRLVAEE